MDKFKMMQDCFREHPDIYGEGQSSRSTFLSEHLIHLGVYNSWDLGRADEL